MFVVDDNPFNILITKNLLKDLDYMVKSASGAEESIEAVKIFAKEEKSIKIIFIDCHTPIMDGYETTKQLKRLMEKGKF